MIDNKNVEYVSCNLCDSKEYKLYKEIDGCRLVKCKRCGLVYLNPRPSQQKINAQYSAKYHIEKLLGRDAETAEGIEAKINENRGRAEEIVNECGEKGKLLDIGCGAGFFIACLKRYDWDVTGVDISRWATTLAKDKLGLNVLTGIVEDIQFSEKFDVITMYHVLEHLPYFFRTLKRVSELLADDGVLIIKGPNLASFDRIWHGKKWRGYDLPFHLYHFNLRTYKTILEKAGFSIKKIVFQYWDPVVHLMEIKIGDGARVDHAPDSIEKLMKGCRHDSIVFKGINKIMNIMKKLLNLRGRDVTIYAERRAGL